MSTIYVVTTGMYSDYSIVAVFDNREQAEKLGLHGKNNAEVEEYTLNPAYTDYAALGYSRFSLCMMKDGAVLALSKLATDLYLEPAIFAVGNTAIVWGNCWCDSLKSVPLLDLNGLHLHVERIAKEEEQVIKAANEKRIQLLAENRWKEYEKI